MRRICSKQRGDHYRVKPMPNSLTWVWMVEYKVESRIKDMRWESVDEFIWLRLGPAAGSSERCDEAKPEVLMAVAWNSAILLHVTP